MKHQISILRILLPLRMRILDLHAWSEKIISCRIEPVWLWLPSPKVSREVEVRCCVEYFEIFRLALPMCRNMPTDPWDVILLFIVGALQAVASAILELLCAAVYVMRNMYCICSMGVVLICLCFCLTGIATM